MISVENALIRAGTFMLGGVSFSIPTGEYGVLMGKTGSGKTTILEAISGLRKVEGGTIRIQGRDVTNLRPRDRGIGYVPQDGALFPTMSVRDNLSFSLVLHRRPAAEIEARVRELAGLLGLTKLLERKPDTLSGGEAQRVALGRAIASRPAVLCLDEPLAALDEDTRDQMCSLLEDVEAFTGATTLHVTHNRSEAKRLADRIFLLENGEIRAVQAADLVSP